MESDLLETLRSFVPSLVARRVAGLDRPLEEPLAERITGAVLFADITDFTTLADSIGGENQAGSEYLANLLNDCFSKIIEIVEEHGGEIVKFAGDALLAIWPIPEGLPRMSQEARQALSACTTRAAHCALDIQSTVSGRNINSDHLLWLQIGLGAGDVYSVHLGGVFNRWEFLLSGDPLVQMTRAKKRARPGKVAMSPEVWSMVRSDCTGRNLGDGFVELVDVSDNPSIPSPEHWTLSPRDVEVIRSYVPAAVLSRMEAGHSEWLSENRSVSVLFIKLPQYGTSIKHPYVRTVPQAQEVMRALQTALYHYAGSINKLNVDDKGITLVAALGLPPLSHRDDAARAVHAAFEMQEALENLGRPSAIGITTGKVFCGPVGSHLRREYTMVGQVVNLAARLMQAAESRLDRSDSLSSVICDEATRSAVLEEATEGHPLARKIQWRAIQGVAIKGRNEPVQAYIPLFNSHPRFSSLPSVYATSSLIGRDAELEALQVKLEALLDGTGTKANNLIVIEGEAGSGKSRLIDELEMRARALRINTLTGAAHSLQVNTPYFAWRAIYRKIFDLDPFIEDPARMRTRVLGQLPPVEGERGFPAFAIRLSPLLNDVLPMAFPENNHTRQMSESERRRTTNFFLLRLLQRTVIGRAGRRSQPTLLILENGHWLDEQSWELLHAAVAQVYPMLIIVVTRPLREQAMGGAIPAACWRVVESDHVTWLTLKPLSRLELSLAICQRLDVDGLPAEMADLLWTRTGGNVFFGEELVRHWQARHCIDIDKRSVRLICPIDDLLDSTLPDSIYKTVTARLERLAPVHQLILKSASVLGPRFSMADMIRVYPIASDSETIAMHAKALLKIGLLVPSEIEPETFEFRYSIISEVAQGLLLRSQRELIQALAAKAQ